MSTVAEKLRNLPMRHKLMVIAMVTSGSALLIAILILAAHDLLTFRRALQTDVASAASVIAQNSTAALAFQDQAVATHNLMGLAERPNIRAACMYDENGKVFASYTPSKQIVCPAQPDQGAAELRLDRLIVYRPVILDNKPVGAVYIESTLKELGDRLKAQVIMFVVVLVISGLIAFLISAKLQRLISGPLLSLSTTAKNVSRTNNFSLRAPKETNDEVGHLVDTFNNMLEQISERDAQRADLLNREHRARSEAEETARRSAFLAEASRVLSSSLDVRETAGALSRLAASALQSWCVIDIRHELRPMRLEAAHSDPGPQEQSHEFLSRAPDLNPNLPVARVIATGRPLLGEFTDEMLRAFGLSEERQAFIRSMKLQRFVAVPLMSRGVVLGAISFASPTLTAYLDADLRMAEQLADRLAVALDNSRLYTELQKSDQLKDEFLATMSHELRTPLTAILGWSRLLKGGKLAPEKTHQAIEIIDRNAEFETRLVDDVLDASRIISGKFTIDFQFVDIAEVLESAVHSIRLSAESKHLKLEAHVDRVPPVLGNPQRLQQVFGNLLSNSVKYTPSHGAITVRLGVRDFSVEVRVTDTGIGITPEFLPHVFERFRQADASSTRRYGGLGLGLAIVRHLVELHGGSVAAQSRGDGLGSTFIVSLPLPDSQRAGPASWDSPEPAALSLDGITALVVEDEGDTRDLIAQIIEQHGGIAQRADSYETALAALQQFTPRILLIDIGMPIHNGYALIAAARSKPQLRHTPAIAVTAYATDSDRDAALAAGFQAHIAKPFEPAALVSQILDLVYRPPSQKRA